MNSNDSESADLDDDPAVGCLQIFVALTGIIIGLVALLALFLIFVEVFIPALIGIVVFALMFGGSDPNDPYDYRNRYPYDYWNHYY